ncbi:glycosyltransferase family 2 protein [Pontibacter akesuensis]|uniref:Glycosyltransferase involved in cell wall bisynthesis n=1 Tax=Pontibacter akesuensis TaxID=388950 RepID=A0A1I7IKP7_9BACT|nr:glycosyltransferase family 2 protein [Pontibacter akesuensis]GHA67635.1 glycosyl transferase [Pontibacter akesuensis]SFU73468.1 Glycosyltransferase involved in cell wall bisynthesis [Pontibacter akesuensis]
MQVSCLIPCYNERQRIAAVLEVVSKVKYIRQVVCVDDGSTDGTADYIKANWPQVLVVQQQRNSGKVAAIQQGLKSITNELVLLMDADLQDLRTDEIEAAIAAITESPSVDMIILRRINSPWFVRWYRSDILLSGERLIRKADLEQVMQLKPERYQLEVAINRYMLRHKKQVRWMPWSARNTYKVNKLGVLDGSKKEFRMYVEIVSFVGFSHMLLQLTSFTRKINAQQQNRGGLPRLLRQFKL